MQVLVTLCAQCRCQTTLIRKIRYGVSLAPQRPQPPDLEECHVVHVASGEESTGNTEMVWSIKPGEPIMARDPGTSAACASIVVPTCGSPPTEILSTVSLSLTFPATRIGRQVSSRWG